MKQYLTGLWNRFEAVSVLETDSPEEQRRKMTLIVITILCCLTGIASGIRTYFLDGIAAGTIMPFIFSTVSGMAILIYLITKRFTILLYSFLILILLGSHDWQQRH